MTGDALERLAEACGVTSAFHDYQGQYRVSSPGAVMATLRALGVPIERADDAGALLAEREAAPPEPPPCRVLWGDAPLELPLTAGPGERFRFKLELEDGDHREIEGVGALSGTVRFDGPLPHGYHRLIDEHGGRWRETHLIVAPPHAWGAPLGSPKRWGLFAPLYAVRRDGGSGAGDLADLFRLAALVQRCGGALLGTLPLLASFLDEPFEPSPYGPVSRLFWNELYLDTARLGAEPTAEQQARARELTELDLVDYRQQAAHVRSLLEPLAERAWKTDRRELQAFADTHPRALDYAMFRATTERHRAIFADWPARQAGGDLAPGDYDEAAGRYHLFVQWAMERQLAELGGATELYLDLPVGVSRYGYDVWRERDLFATGTSAGAPPDALFSGGQNWGSPPIDPRRSRESGHRYFAEAVRHHMRHASLLRVDHVIGMHRLYWIADGFEATDGCYIRYPSDELYAVLCIESHRNQCAVAGEDLGTVPPEVAPTLESRGMHRLFVGEFGLPGSVDEPLAEPPFSSVASLNTHDTPTFAGFWGGHEIDDRVEMGLLDDDQAAGERAGRERQRQASIARWQISTDGDPRPGVLRAWHRELAASDARVLLVTLEDLWLETRPQNVPGTGPERPNWRRRMSRTLDEVERDDEIEASLREIDQVRRS
jgi:4-alpha-glucanotransferase